MRRRRRVLLATLLLVVGTGACTRDAGDSPADPTLPLHNEDGTRPNVLLISIDTLRADHLGAYGYDLPTSPAIDALAARGALFLRAVSPASETAPGAASLITGRYQHRHGAWRNVVALPSDVTTLAEHMADAGYRTAGLVGNRLLGEKFGFDQGFSSYEGFWTDDMDVASDDVGVSMAIDWLDDAGDATDAPWFLWLHLMDPHGPYTSAPASWSEDLEYPPGRFGADAPVRRAISNYALDAIPRYQWIGEHAKLSYYVRRYDGEIRFTDTQVGRLLGALAERDLDTRTLVVLSADHGESLTEHGEYLQHGWYVYDTTLHVPLIVAWPGRLPAGTVVDVPASTIDVVPTIVELLDLPASAHSFDGVSLAPALLGVAAPPDRSLFALGARANHPFALSRGRWKLIHTRAGAPPDALAKRPAQGFETPERIELYDVVDDPGETRNLAGANPALVSDMLGELVGFELKVRTNLPQAVQPDSR